MISVSSFSRNLAAFALLATLAWTPLAAQDASLDDAVRLYEAGRYAEALPLLEKIVADGKADGITHYRLYFCRRSAGAPNPQQALESARALLEKEVKTATGFEAGFYLSNTYTNLGQTEQVERLAAELTARLEAGEIPAPDEAVEQFRLGKLYNDQGRALDAQPWFAKAVDGFAEAAETKNLPYFEWTARWLGQRALADERFEAAAKQYEHLRAAGKATLPDLDNLGMSSLMIGDYARAGEAFRAAARLNPADADRFRYGAGLAQLAGREEELPISPDGDRSWEEVSREELENLMRETSQKVREVRAEIEAADKLTGEQVTEFTTRLIEPRPMFTAAALEYMRRGLSLREAAFFGGYAPLIFKPREWDLIPPIRPSVTPREAAAERERRLKLRAATAEEVSGDKPEEEAEPEKKSKKRKKEKKDRKD